MDEQDRNGYEQTRWSGRSSVTSSSPIGSTRSPGPAGSGPQIALWALRIFVIVVGAMVIYTFFAQL